jgi:hypothetical protein
MADGAVRLDGNAAAGLLEEIFTFDVTLAWVTCAGCGVEGPVAKLAAYGMAMGAILRCPSCDTPVMRVSRLGAGYGLDLRGTTLMLVGQNS